jgi:phosphoribosylanthranilate isomerase
MKLKVCGMKYSDNIRQVAELRPDYIGFVFYEGSKRFVGHNFVMPEISGEIQKAGIFVNAAEDLILNTIQKYALDLVQLHGEEDPEFCERISKHTRVVKAFGIDESFDLKVLDNYKSHCSYFLFDYKSDNFDGSVKPFNWELLKDYDNSVPFFIAGGMDLEKYRRIESLNLNVYGIDVNSRMEIKPGYKDIIKIIQIRNHIR